MRLIYNHFSFTERDGGKEWYNRPGILECVEHESIDISDESALMSSDSSCEDFEVDAESIHGTSNSLCVTPAEQLSSDCQILGMLGPDSPEEE